jgi:tripeptidyl-peptidase-1
MNFVVKERRLRNEAAKMEKMGTPEGSLMHEVVIATRQDNIATLESQLKNEMIPRINDDGFRWLTFEEVNRVTERTDSQALVKGWLDKQGVNVTWVSKSSHFLKAKAEITKWETMLDTRFYVWRSPIHENALIQSEDYSVPEYLDDHIHAIFNTCQTPPVLQQSARRLSDDDSNNGTAEAAATNALTPKPPGTTTVGLLKSFYRVSSSLTGYANQRQSVFETANQYYSTSDLASFQDRFELMISPAESIGEHSLTTPTMCSTAATNPSPDCYEGNLDIQYIMGISQNTSSVYWYVSGGNPFVQWLLEVEDDPDPPKVNSVSWGVTEQAIGKTTFESFENAAIKLAIQGVTIVVASGDNGVMNGGFNSNGVCDSSVCSDDSSSNIASNWDGPSWSGQGYFPSWPATSPYVTAVGATMGPESGEPEVTCQSDYCYVQGSNIGGVITSGGGFSTYYPQPDWQKSAVDAYFEATSTPSPGFNPNGRAIPDIALIGAKYQVVVANYISFMYGTSATAPVFAGFVSLVNARRAAAGKVSIGFLNPLLYSCGNNITVSSNGTLKGCLIFNDITSGSNKCCSSSYCAQAVCCSAGFETSNGWDPVTGWGSVKFDEFASVFNVSAPYIPNPANDTVSNFLRAQQITMLEIYIVSACVAFVCLVIFAYCSIRFYRKTRELTRDEVEEASAQAARTAAVATVARGEAPTITAETLEDTISPLPLPPAARVINTDVGTDNYRSPPRSRGTSAPQYNDDSEHEYGCPSCGQTFCDPVALVEHSGNCTFSKTENFSDKIV